jgi:hypothetical protein
VYLGAAREVVSSTQKYDAILTLSTTLEIHSSTALEVQST